MAEHFLTKTRIDLSRCIAAGDAPAVEQYEAFNALLMAKAGPDVAKLFAEPLVSKGNDQAASTVSWYCDRAGQGVPLSKLDTAEQNEVATALRARLSTLKDLLDDDEAAPLVAAALHIGSAGDIWAVGGHPVIVNWGLMPAEGSDAATRSVHYARTLGPYLAMDGAPPLTQQEQEQRRGEKIAAVAAASAIAGAAAGTAATAGTVDATEPVANAAQGTTAGATATAGGATDDPSAPVPGERPARGRVPLVAWVPLVLLLLLFGGALAWLLVPGNRIFADDGVQPAVTDEDTLRAAREINRALEQRLADLNVALEGAVCRADGTLLMPDGLTIEGLLPPGFDEGTLRAGEIIKADRTPILPPASDRVMIPPADGDITDTATLLNHIDDRTAMVVAVSDQGTATGTGFFVGPDLLVSNFHVVEGADAQNILVVSKAMDGPKRVDVLKSLGPVADVGADFALLRVLDVDQPFYTLRQSDQSMRLQSVIAAGYPGDVLRINSDFQSLSSSNNFDVPDLIVTDGSVNSEQSLSDRAHAVIHSAPLSGGNSGGPLVDMCGRVVGVNTFVYQGELRNLNFALSIDDLLEFLADTPAAPTISSEVCEPFVARPAPVSVSAGQ
ncbi:serine protease [Roseobacter denitrificans]|uniref:Periplasmic serine proteinase, putative n=1 Tax=Roseobacter denitrificans (strain ATCC 33942 / OCh 114) TaxID=375451 RepID=Q16BG0_ROSDO|nr:trypsin-like peptidase domain-containing protein [Roseobacter denitrificans]ABG30683.1 periplasmic serine proteinase, putative [Roseobacter denitrificans OCh 114]AVL53809.1 serine protease [Roseobacter denitrificans]SFG18517.1 Trypsin-like peptidase domain-containing protein [Roseobacter denitrificans OCh 114]